MNLALYRVVHAKLGGLNVKKTLVLAVMVLLFGAGQAAGSLWTYYDFGDPFDHNNNWSPIDYPYIGNLPSPGMFGEGGEYADLEGAFAAADETYLYFGLTNSFGLRAYSQDQNRYYDLGALFFGFGCANTDYAIGDFSPGRSFSLAKVSSYELIPTGIGGYEGDIRDQVGAYMPTNPEILGGVDFLMTAHEGLEPNPLYPSTNDSTWTLEVRVAKSLFYDVDFMTVDMVSVHQTLACGNDLIEETFDIPCDIPEPGTLVLLGLGLLGAGIARIYRR
jgi:hypothetical protein